MVSKNAVKIAQEIADAALNASAGDAATYKEAIVPLIAAQLMRPIPHDRESEEDVRNGTIRSVEGVGRMSAEAALAMVDTIVDQPLPKNDRDLTPQLSIGIIKIQRALIIALAKFLKPFIYPTNGTFH